MSLCQCEVYEVCPVCNPDAHAREVARLKAHAAAQEKKGINLDDLEWEAQGLLNLLKERELGLMSWNMMLKDKIVNLRKLTEGVE